MAKASAIEGTGSIILFPSGKVFEFEFGMALLFLQVLEDPGVAVLLDLHAVLDGEVERGLCGDHGLLPLLALRVRAHDGVRALGALAVDLRDALARPKMIGIAYFIIMFKPPWTKAVFFFEGIVIGACGFMLFDNPYNIGFAVIGLIIVIIAILAYLQKLPAPILKFFYK